ncbi:restriction endonuclease [Streptacidiphilus sp. EB103A]|uniref:restriction endonuclease n=1 Tax=Streptacidiphilus sp. EB103A TaxID=3156275 RepID=UPI0035170961
MTLRQEGVVDDRFGRCADSRSAAFAAIAGRWTRLRQWAPAGGVERRRGRRLRSKPARRRGTIDRHHHLRLLAWRGLYRTPEVLGMVLMLCTIGLLAGRWTGWWPSPFHLAVDCVGPVGFCSYVYFSTRRSIRADWDARLAAGPQLQLTLDQLTALGPIPFETAVRDLMRRDGFRAEQVGGANDDAVDVWARDMDGWVWVVQCKHRRDGLASKQRTDAKVIRELKGTASDMHRATFAIVVTNGRFTANAVEKAAVLGVHLLDGIQLAQWATQERSLRDLLGVPAPLRHPADFERNR